MDSFTPLQTAWQQLIAMARGAIELLPNILIAIIVSIIFWFIAKFSRRLIKNFTRRKQSRNLGLVLARLSQGFIILVGAFVANGSCWDRSAVSHSANTVPRSDRINRWRSRKSKRRLACS